jgi:hypothetical protein
VTSITRCIRLLVGRVLRRQEREFARLETESQTLRGVMGRLTLDSQVVAMR